MKNIVFAALLFIILSLTSPILAASDCCPADSGTVKSGASCPLETSTVSLTKPLNNANGTSACNLSAQTCAPGSCPMVPADLNMNIQQTNKVKLICSDHQKKVASLKTSIAAGKAKLAVILDSAKPNKNAAFAQLKKINELEMKLQQSDIEAFVAIKATLTPAQASRLSAKTVVGMWSVCQMECCLKSKSAAK